MLSKVYDTPRPRIKNPCSKQCSIKSKFAESKFQIKVNVRSRLSDQASSCFSRRTKLQMGRS